MFLERIFIFLSTCLFLQHTTNASVTPVVDTGVRSIVSSLWPQIEFVQEPDNDAVSIPVAMCSKEITEKCCSPDNTFRQLFTFTPPVVAGGRSRATVPGWPELLKPVFNAAQLFLSAPLEHILGHLTHNPAPDSSPGLLRMSLSGDIYILEALRSIFTASGPGILNLPKIILLILHLRTPFLAKLLLLLAFIIRLPILVYCRITQAIRALLTPFMQMLKRTLLPVYLIIRLIHFVIWTPIRFIGFMIHHTLLGILEFCYRIVMGIRC